MRLHLHLIAFTHFLTTEIFALSLLGNKLKGPSERMSLSGNIIDSDVYTNCSLVVPVEGITFADHQSCIDRCRIGDMSGCKSGVEAMDVGSRLLTHDGFFFLVGQPMDDPDPMKCAEECFSREDCVWWQIGLDESSLTCATATLDDLVWSPFNERRMCDLRHYQRALLCEGQPIEYIAGLDFSMNYDKDDEVQLQSRFGGGAYPFKELCKMIPGHEKVEKASFSQEYISHHGDYPICTSDKYNPAWNEMFDCLSNASGGECPPGCLSTEDGFNYGKLMHDGYNFLPNAYLPKRTLNMLQFDPVECAILCWREADCRYWQILKHDPDFWMCLRFTEADFRELQSPEYDFDGLQQMSCGQTHFAFFGNLDYWEGDSVAEYRTFGGWAHGYFMQDICDTWKH